MTWVDNLALLILGISVLISVWRGAVRELFSLLGWIAAYFAAVHFADSVAALMPKAIETENLRLFAAYILVFASVVLLTTILGIALSTLLKAFGLGLFDRLFGAIIGLIRGLVIVFGLIVAAGLTSLPSKADWRNSMFSPLFEKAAEVAKPVLPESLAKNIRYN